MDNKDGAVKTQEPVASEVCNFAARLAERAEILAQRVDNKLHSVATSARPQCGEELLKESREYPPLFSELRGRFYAIEMALNQIEDTISRTEL